MESNFEVYSKSGGRWMLEARYGAHEKNAALADAKDMERQSNIEGVRVVHGIHNPGTGETKEKTVYITATLKKATSPAGRPMQDRSDGMAGGGSASPFGEDDDEDDDGGRSGFLSGLFGRKKSRDDDEDDAGPGGPGAEAVAAAADGSLATAQAGKPASSGSRASMVVMKFMIILVVSFGIATASSFIYSWMS